MWFVNLYLILIALARGAVADSENYFIEPGPQTANGDYSSNPLVFTGDSMLIEWSTTYDAYDLQLWQQSPVTFAVTMVAQVGALAYGAGSFKKQWVVEVDDDILARSPVFSFWIAPRTNSDLIFTSRFFNITNGSSISTSSPSTSIPPTASPTTMHSTSLGSTASFPTERTLTATTSTTSDLTFIATASKITDRASEPTNATIRTLSSTAPMETANGTDTSNTESKKLNFRLGMGLGLGIPILLIAGAAIGVAVDRRRKSSGASTEASTESGTPLTQIPEKKSHAEPESPITSPFIVSPEEPVFSPAVSELRGREIYEMPANESKVELGSR